MASTWLVAFYTGAMLYPKTLIMQLLKSRPNAASNLLIGVLLDSRLASTTNHRLLFPVEIWPKYPVRCVCFPTQLLLLRLGPDLTTSLISCMPREPLFIGTLERVWKRVSSLKPAKIWPLLKKITKTWAWTLLMMKARLEKSINFRFRQKNSSNYPLTSPAASTQVFLLQLYYF